MKTFFCIAGSVLFLLLAPFIIGTVCASTYYWSFHHPGLWLPQSRAIAMMFSGAMMLILTSGAVS